MQILRVTELQTTSDLGQSLFASADQVMLFRRRAKSDLPRYFICQSGVDVIVLDVAADSYYWRAETPTSAFFEAGGSGHDKQVICQVVQPARRDGLLPRGRHRHWEFRLGLVLKGLYLLGRARRMANRGFGGFASDLNNRLVGMAPRGISDVEELRAISSAMAWARILFPFEAKCLVLSIATVELARSRGIDARLVVGVHALPIRAHAWVQVGDRLLTDSMDRIRAFNPLMSLPCEI